MKTKDKDMTPRKIFTAFVILLTAVASSGPSAASATGSGDTHGKGASTPSCAKAAFALAMHSYAVSYHDCSPGSRTFKAAVHFQRASGLYPDGIVGPVTWEALVNAADATAQAERLTPHVLQAQSAPQLTGCDEMHAYMDMVDLPHGYMDGIGWRESNCKNTVTSSTGCCVGWFQININNRTAPGYRAGFAFCGVYTKDDMRGASYEQKLAQVCVAKVMWDVWQAGGSSNPWRL